MIKLKDCPKEIQEKVLSSDSEMLNAFARNCDIKYLPLLINNKDEDVRLIVAYRIDPKYLPEMIDDPTYQVRFWVAERIDESYLYRLKCKNDLKNDKYNKIIEEKCNYRLKSYKKTKCKICYKVKV